MVCTILIDKGHFVKYYYLFFNIFFNFFCFLPIFCLPYYIYRVKNKFFVKRS